MHGVLLKVKTWIKVTIRLELERLLQIMEPKYGKILLLEIGEAEVRVWI